MSLVGILFMLRVIYENFLMCVVNVFGGKLFIVFMFGSEVVSDVLCCMFVFMLLGVIGYGV